MIKRLRYMFFEILIDNPGILPAGYYAREYTERTTFKRKAFGLYYKVTAPTDVMSGWIVALPFLQIAHLTLPEGYQNGMH